MIKIKTVLLLLILWNSHIDAQEKVRFTPRWTPQAQFAGFYVAQELGFFKELGLDVEFKHPSASVNAMEMLKNNQTDIVDCSLSDAIIEKSQGVDLMNIVQLFQRTSLVIVADRPLNNDIRKLTGLRIGRWRAGHSVVAVMAIKDKGIDVEWVNFLSGSNLFLSGAVNASLAMTYNELISMKSTGRKIDDENVIRLSDLGYNVIEDGLYTDRDYAKENSALIEKFRQASIRGWLWAQQNPEKTLDIVMDYVAKSNIKTNRYHQSEMLKEILLLEYPLNSDKISFNLAEKDFNVAHEMLLKTEQIKRSITYDSFIIK